MLIKLKKLVHCKTLLSHIKMGKEIITFSDIEFKENKLHRYKDPNF